jgi:Tol biopolymer transport system component
VLILLAALGNAAEDPEVQKLAQEVGKKGWLVFSARTEKGDFDLFIARPDGSGLRNITNNPPYDDYGGRFSPDGKKLLFRCLKKGTSVNHVDWGHLGTLVIANADGSNPEDQGKENEYPWASWSPDGSRIACLYRREGKIRIFDLQTRKLVRESPNQGIFRQVQWSSDGERFCGTANVAGGAWNIGAIEIKAGKFTQVSRGVSCTPDWFQSDPMRILYSNGDGRDNDQGWTTLMQGRADGKSRSLIYAERKQHIYFGCTSPDDQYVVFSRRSHNDGPIEGPMAIVRLADTPIIGPEAYPLADTKFPNARRGPVCLLDKLPKGFEPHWTYADVGGLPTQ